MRTRNCLSSTTGVHIRDGLEDVGRPAFPRGQEVWRCEVESSCVFLYIADTGLLALRAEPSEDGEPILTFPGGIGGHLLTRLELRGDWMRVRIEVHGYRCPSEPPWEGVDVMEGWVRWRGADGVPNIESISGVC